jgi:pimeloyl-ACP methyl ester carboxylesterase
MNAGTWSAHVAMHQSVRRAGSRGFPAQQVQASILLSPWHDGEHFMASRSARTTGFRTLLIIASLAPFAGFAQVPGPLTIKEQGSFFVGGEHRTISAPATGVIPAQSGEITVNQMYVQYQIPLKGARHVPVVFVHGCCLSSKTWETTPDGRMGWSEYFVRKGRSVYLADQVSRARSGFDPTNFNAVHTGKLASAQMPGILDATHQFAWSVFRFGPKFGEGFKDEQFPIEAVEELYKQMIPDLNSTLSQNPNPTLTQMAALGVKLHGAILVGHSESGFFPEQAALLDPTGVKGLVTIEMQCDTHLSAAQLAALAKIPTLIMFGDHLADVKAPFSWMDALTSCNTFVDQLKKAGGDATMMYLPAMGIKGNSHMLMQDKNSNQLADLVIAWIDKHVENRGRDRK